MGRRWVTAAGTIRAIAEIDPALAARIFGSRDAIALGGWPGATTGRSWASSARFAEDVANDAILGDLQVAMYDPEHWDATPLEEQLDPHASIETFGTLARSKGYTVLITPHPNIVSVPGSPLAPRDGETRESAYLRSGIAEVAAANADVIETQAQTLQGDPERYRAFVAETVRLARATKRGHRGALRSVDAPRVPGDGRDVAERLDIRARRCRRALSVARAPAPARGGDGVPCRDDHDGPLTGEGEDTGSAIGAGLRQLVFVRQITYVIAPSGIWIP
jgi:hypothetical protein